jgi:tRNA(Leu) C34 or U34 (ribose-2'-O)-methylase TrmL
VKATAASAKNLRRSLIRKAAKVKTRIHKNPRTNRERVKTRTRTSKVTINSKTPGLKVAVNSRAILIGAQTKQIPHNLVRSVPAFQRPLQWVES